MLTSLPLQNYLVASISRRKEWTSNDISKFSLQYWQSFATGLSSPLLHPWKQEKIQMWNLMKEIWPYCSVQLINIFATLQFRSSASKRSQIYCIRCKYMYLCLPRQKVSWISDFISRKVPWFISVGLSMLVCFFIMIVFPYLFLEF